MPPSGEGVRGANANASRSRTHEATDDLTTAEGIRRAQARLRGESYRPRGKSEPRTSNATQKRAERRITFADAAKGMELLDPVDFPRLSHGGQDGSRSRAPSAVRSVDPLSPEVLALVTELAVRLQGVAVSGSSPNVPSADVASDSGDRS